MRAPGSSPTRQEFQRQTRSATLAGDPIAVDLTAEGPWMPAEEIPLASIAAAEAAPVSEPESSEPVPTTAPTIGSVPEPPVRDTLAGTVSIRNANWKADYLAGHIVVNQATLHIENGDLRWDPVDFTYGPLKATASLTAAIDLRSGTNSASAMPGSVPTALC